MGDAPSAQIPGTRDKSLDRDASPPSLEARMDHEAGATTAEGSYKGSGLGRGVRFWTVMGTLMLAFVISALDGAVVSTALPTITEDFNIGAGYVWVVNIYFLTTAAVQPVLGQLSDIWGRRWVFISTVALFVLGSGISGSAHHL